MRVVRLLSNLPQEHTTVWPCMPDCKQLLKRSCSATATATADPQTPTHHPHNSLTFKQPDNAKYPSMNLAYAAGRAGGTMTGVLSAANEQVRGAMGLRVEILGVECLHKP